MSVKAGVHSLYTDNWRWPDVDRSSGGRRRFLFIQTPRTVTRRSPFLIERLKGDANGLVKWALGMPPNKIRIGHSVETLNELTGGGADCSGFIEWVTKKVRYDPGAEIPLGAKKVPIPGSLYEDYILYVDGNGIEPIPFNQFANALDDVIRSQGYRDVVIRRRSIGRVVQGLRLGHGEPIRKNKITGLMRYLMKTDPWPGFKEGKEGWERGGCEIVDHVEGVDDVDSVDSANLLSSREYVDGKEDEAKAEGTLPYKLGEPIQEEGLAVEAKEGEPLPNLTPPEVEKTLEFLGQYLELREAYRIKEVWTEDQMV
ncbi:hypothetical protein GOP47_0019063 [Adiantum capillus-veneris]|uniref:Uncharacterized protein n=1 Tax=Adiantum capillus-veneris TaxID=13818 RepID=A0A9D4UEE3_ADICA|nr:hypothetical protein GOP47_0019063 [Adiantum capillus-veneris]